MTKNDSLSTRQRKFIAAMVSSPTIAEAANVAGIAEKTACRYLGDPVVKRALSKALDDALSQATTRTVSAMGAAVGTLEEIHQDAEQPAAARVSAARAILEGGPKLKDAVDMAARVSALEAPQGER